MRLLVVNHQAIFRLSAVHVRSNRLLHSIAGHMHINFKPKAQLRHTSSSSFGSSITNSSLPPSWPSALYSGHSITPFDIHEEQQRDNQVEYTGPQLTEEETYKKIKMLDEQINEMDSISYTSITADEDDNEDHSYTLDYKELTVDMYNDLIRTDADREKVEQLLTDYELIKYDSGKVPTKLTIDHMQYLMDNMPSREETAYYVKLVNIFKYLFSKEVANLREKEKAQQRKVLVKERLNEKHKEMPARTGLLYERSGRPHYGKWHNTMFINLSPKMLRRPNDAKVMAASQFGPRIVIDFGFESAMNHRNVINMVTQILLIIGDNQEAVNPYNMWFCNLNPESETARRLKLVHEPLYTSNSLITCTEKSYTELFDRRRLIYLTSDAERPLRQVPHDAIFIIGALNDRNETKPLCYRKAKMENIPTYKFPVDDFLFFKMGRKTLTINQAFSIMQMVKDDGDWAKAFDTHVPKRKLKTLVEVQDEQARRIEKLMLRKKLFNENKQPRHPYGQTFGNSFGSHQRTRTGSDEQGIFYE